jgi:hypothetical protein
MKDEIIQTQMFLTKGKFLLIKYAAAEFWNSNRPKLTPIEN